MRRWLPVCLLLLTLLAGCSRGQESKPSAPAEPVTQPAPPVAEAQRPKVEPPPAPVTPQPPASPVKTYLKPEPEGGLKALITPAAAGEVERLRLKPGQAAEKPGIYFLNVATGEVDGFVGMDRPDYYLPGYSASDDNRWAVIPTKQGTYLADRESGSLHRWPSDGIRLVAARGNLLLLMTGSRYWVSAEGPAPDRFRPVDLPLWGALPAAIFAPDGKSLLLANGTGIYQVETASGKARAIGAFAPEAGGLTLSTVTATPAKQGEEAVVQAEFGWGRRGLTRVQRYSLAQGKLLADQTLPGEGYPAPDGVHMAWQVPLFGLADAVLIGTADRKPLLRMTGEARCGVPYQGPYWLPDSSGMILSTSNGPRLLRLDGTLAPLPGDGRFSVPVPAPDRADRFAVGITRVVDSNGKVLAQVNDGKPIPVGDIYPWGDRSDELRLVIREIPGRGVPCEPHIFAPAVEKAPLPEIIGLQVKVEKGDCVNLRQSWGQESKAVTCLPNGARLTPAVPLGRLNKGRLEQWGNPYPTGMDSNYWWYVRTESGQKGWVFLDDDYLTWAVARPGEPAPDLFQARVNDEIAGLRWWLQVALGADCQGRCYEGEGMSAVKGLIGWCETEPARQLRTDPDYDPKRHEAGVALIESSCQALQSARKSLGHPESGPEWTARVNEVLGRLPAESARP